ncbi:hypothetical protein Tco_1490277, partial [Tanacetum coccineum]
MVVRTLDVEKDHFWPPSDDEEILGPEVPYLSAIRALLFMSNKNTLEWGETNILLSSSSNAAMSWCSVKQTMGATSSNHAKILAIHDASRECVWLRSVIQHIRESCGISSGQEAPAVIHEDNATCIAQLKDEYIK